MTTPWPLPLLLTSWGFRTYGDKWRTPDELADYAAAAGCPSVAVQLGDEPTTGLPNCYPGEAQRLRERGLHVVVWGVAAASYVQRELERLQAAPLDWMPQVEDGAQRELVIEQAAAGIRSAVIVSTYGGASTPAEVEALRKAGIKAVLVEIYTAGGQTDVDLMLWQGTMYGWREDELFACLGTYHGELPNSYTDTQNIGRNFALYLAEPMSSEQFHQWGEFNTKAPPPTPEDDDMDAISDAQALDSHKTISQAALSGYTDPPTKPVGRNTIIWRIANADDTSWKKCRDHIKSDLDAAGVPQVPE